MVEERQNLNGLGRLLRSHFIILLSLIALMWLLEGIDFIFFRQGLNNLGVRPRTMGGLFSIFLMPLLHSGFDHLTANTVPLLFLGWLVMVRRMADFFVVTLLVVVVSGFGVWLLGGTNTIHIGASGLIFGYFGYLLARGFFDKSVTSFLLTVVVLLFYSSLIFGILPIFQNGVSWQGHLFGFFGGVWAASIITKRIRTAEEEEVEINFL